MTLVHSSTAARVGVDAGLADLGIQVAQMVERAEVTLADLARIGNQVTHVRLGEGEALVCPSSILDVGTSSPRLPFKLMNAVSMAIAL